MYKLDPKKNVSIGDVMTFSELCDLFNRKPTTNRSTQMKAINAWLDVERVDKTHYKITGIHLSEMVTEKRPKGRPRLSEEEKARRAAIKEANRRPVGRPKMTLEEKEEARKKREAQKPVEGKRPVGRPKLTEEERAEREAAKLEKRKFRTAKFQKRKGRPKKYETKEKSYNYQLRKDAIIALPARDIILYKLMKNRGQISGNQSDFVLMLGLANEYYYNPDATDKPDLDFTSLALSSVGYYTNLTLNNMLSMNIFQGLSTNNKLFLIEPIYFYHKTYYDYVNNKRNVADAVTIKYIQDLLHNIMTKYNAQSEAELFYKTKQFKNAREEFYDTIKSNFKWYSLSRGKKLTINGELAADLGNEILSVDIEQSKRDLNKASANKIQNYLYKHGQKLYGYNPNTVINFGEESKGVKQLYDKYCSDIDIFINKYIRLDPV